MILSSLRTKLFLLNILFVPLICFGQLEYHTGAKQEDNAYNQIQAYEESFRGSVPKSYSIKQYTPKVGNQLRFKHSVGWSIAYSTTILESIGYGRVNKSEITRSMKSPYFINMLLSDSVAVCESDISLSESLYLLSEFGIPGLLDYIDICPSGKNQKAIEKADKSNYFTYYKLFETNETTQQKAEKIKKKLVMDKPVIVGFHCPPSFVHAGEFWKPTELFDPKFPLQALTIVGFDDEKHGGAFEVMNSWGKDWGNEGFIWIPFEELDFLRYGFSVETSYGGDEPLNFSGAFRLELSDSSMVEVVQGRQRGLFNALVTEDNFAFRFKGESNKPVFVKAYYKGENGDVSQIYPTSSWRSSLLEHTFRSYNLPDADNYYTINNEIFFRLYFFISPGSLDETDFTGLIKNSDSMLDILRTADLDFSKNVVWDAEKGKYFSRLQEKDIIPMIVEFDIIKARKLVDDQSE